MVIERARRRVVAWRQPTSAVRIARALWIAWAVMLWNVVFDHVVVVAGRTAIAVAERAATGINIDEIMRPAVSRGLWIATSAASSVLIIGLTSIQLARSR